MTHESLRSGDPAAVLGALDASVSRQLELYATAICIVWCAASGRLRLANAGHIPPVVVGNRDPFFLSSASGPPLGLGAPGPARSTTCRRMPPSCSARTVWSSAGSDRSRPDWPSSKRS